jgi:hypothetical protein
MRLQNYDTLDILLGRRWDEFKYYSVPHRAYKPFASEPTLNMVGCGRIFICVMNDLLRHECPEIETWEARAALWVEFYYEPFVDGNGSSADPYVIYD